MGLPQGAGGSPLYSHLTGTVHDPGSDAVRKIALIWGRTASDGAHGRERSPLLDHIENVLPRGNHSPGCWDGGCSSVGKKLLAVGNQSHQILQ